MVRLINDKIVTYGFVYSVRLMRDGGVVGVMASMDSSLPTMSNSTVPPSEHCHYNYYYYYYYVTMSPQSCFILYNYNMQDVFSSPPLPPPCRFPLLTHKL